SFHKVPLNKAVLPTWKEHTKQGLGCQIAFLGKIALSIHSQSHGGVWLLMFPSQPWHHRYCSRVLRYPGYLVKRYRCSVRPAWRQKSIHHRQNRQKIPFHPCCCAHTIYEYPLAPCGILAWPVHILSSRGHGQQNRSHSSNPTQLKAYR